MKKFFMSLSLMLAVASAAVAATSKLGTCIGYCVDRFDRGSGVRFGSSENQGLAIKLTKDKLDLLRGKQIKAVRFVIGTSNFDAFSLFISKDLNADPVYTQDAEGRAATWNEVALTTPYTIGDEQELYIGYNLTASSAYSPLILDQQAGMAGKAFYYNGSAWTDAFSSSYGMPSIQIVVDQMSLTDLTVKDFNVNDYYIAGNSYTYTAEVFNFGTEAIKSFDVTFSIGNGQEQKQSFTGLNIAQAGTYSFTLPEYLSNESGDLPIELAVSNINGSTDASETDNTVSNTIFIYPADVRKSVLLEGFTGQSCPNCPTGHVYIEGALERFSGDVVEVFHHIGYYPDTLTMEEESYYLGFYGESTYAPAVAVNRLYGEGESSIAKDVNGNGIAGVLSYLNYANTIQPYFNIDIATKYDPATRRVSGDVLVYPYVMPQADTLMVSLFLVQDSIRMFQSSGGSKYLHRYTYRGSLFGTIGMRANLERGKIETYPVDYVLPEKIKSTYFGAAADERFEIPTDLDNMYLVAFVSKYQVNSDGSLDCPVYNVAKVKLSADNTTGISDVEAQAAPAISLSGNRVSVSGAYDRVEVYDMSGRAVKSLSGQAVEFTLPDGLYIVRAAGAAGSTSRKVAVY